MHRHTWEGEREEGREKERGSLEGGINFKKTFETTFKIYENSNQSNHYLQIWLSVEKSNQVVCLFVLMVGCWGGEKMIMLQKLPNSLMESSNSAFFLSHSFDEWVNGFIGLKGRE